MIGIIYIRSLIAITGICAMMIYLGATDTLPEALAAIVASVYLDKGVSGNND